MSPGSRSTEWSEVTVFLRFNSRRVHSSNFVRLVPSPTFANAERLLSPGESVLDLGSGSGMDVFVAALYVTEGGFTRFRRAAETPTSLVFEAKPWLLS
ncbi:MAG: hypothetical protein ACOCQY_02410 [Halorhabdus sp.]